MAQRQGSALVRYIRRLAGAPQVAASTDRQLLERFTAFREESAFTTLMERHGPMVLGVCRRILRNEHDVEDAFQATFLVLARKAASQRWQESVGSWLYEVACRVARKARADRARRQNREKPVHTMPSVDPFSQAVGREIQNLLEEELCRLPEKYRLPVVLCCLEGSSRSQAAQQLGWKEGTVAGRLARGRSLLQKRLARRGVTVPSALLTAMLTRNLATASVPAALLMSTAHAASLVAAGQLAAGGLISAPAATLAKEALRAMFFTKLQVAAMVLAVAVTTTGTGMLAHQLLVGKESDKEQMERPARAAQSASKAKEDPPQQARTDSYGDPLPSGAVARLGTVRLRQAVSSPSNLAFTADGRSLVAARTDKIVQFWEVKTGKPLFAFRQGTRFGCFALHAKVLAMAGPDGVTIWDVEKKKSECAKFMQEEFVPSQSPRMAKRWPRWGTMPSSACGTWPRARRMAASRIAWM